MFARLQAGYRWGLEVGTLFINTEAAVQAMEHMWSRDLGVFCLFLSSEAQRRKKKKKKAICSLSPLPMPSLILILCHGQAVLSNSAHRETPLRMASELEMAVIVAEGGEVKAVVACRG